ncbi:MAG: 4-(cytidine 5'-diphospho)-2-C-methyl-D-erythritol kinase [bacterium]
MPVSSQSIRLPSYAKINLGLYVKGKRKDGFHDIETILQQIDLQDDIQLTVRKDRQIVFHSNAPSLPNDHTNLCFRAAKLLQEHAHVTSGAEIRLAKVIPVGAGLGGGSSNGAVTLLGLNRLWNLDLSVDMLTCLAAQLGSDVPFFIRGGTAFATGRGDRLEPLERPVAQKTILVVFPEIYVSTRWAYENLNLDLTMSKKNRNFLSFKDKIIKDVDFFGLLSNDFEATVFAKYPELAAVKRGMLENGAQFVSLSGSGSTIFGLFERKSRAENAQRLFPDYRTFVSRFIAWGYDEIN